MRWEGRTAQYCQCVNICQREVRDQGQGGQVLLLTAVVSGASGSGRLLQMERSSVSYHFFLKYHVI